ncbi:sensor histidine kinase [Streptomyces xiangluensis]|uniref:histidine kinase n=1 Tax=Streptomyces xiangluensis TaxID=2665720 RepID=A0ABV8YSU9_9ACTN
MAAVPQASSPELTAACQTAGIKVTVTTEGTPQPLSPGVDLTAFRIVQEALTNVTKHASAKAACIQLEYARDRLTLTVTDNGTATAPAAADAPAAGRGFGLVGMRERAQSVGGELCAGPRREGGFEVTTTLPLHPQDAQATQATQNARDARDAAPKEQTT